MPDRIDLAHWIQRRALEDDRLYAQYGQVLEADHAGQFVAIHDDGQLIVGADELTVAKQAIARFAPGTFALRRIGAEAETRLRSSVPC